MQLAVHRYPSRVPVIPAGRPYPLRRATGTVVQVQRAAHDVVRLRIAVDGRPFLFEPGQHADVTFDDLPARPYWIANMPGDPLLELHVRVVPGGIVGAYVANHVREGARVRLQGPYGSGFAAKPAGEPILMVAGGVGLAAIKSILLSTLADATEDAGPIHLYHGVREARDLYDIDAIAAAGGGCVHYVRIVTAPSVDMPCRLGLVHEAVESDFPSLAGFKVCVAGSPPMVEACVATAIALGARAHDVRAEALHAARDSRDPGAQRAAGSMSMYFQKLYVSSGERR